MNRYVNKCFIAIGFLLSFACNDPENPELPLPIDENLVRLRNVLEGQLATPEGKLKSESDYFGSRSLKTRTDFYYDELGRELLKVGLYDSDTIGFYLNEYLEDGNLNRTSVFRLGAEGLFFDFEWQRFYEDDGRTIRVELGRDGIFEEYERFEYDDLVRKVTYRRGDDEFYELHEYFYIDENDSLIREEHVRESGMEIPFYRYRYDYNHENLLIAKSTNMFAGEFRSAFEYKYDSQGRLIEEITNGISFGEDPMERKTFVYY